MSLKLWCPDCNTQTIVDMMSVYDGYEFACDDCERVFYVRIERGLTPLALDGATAPLGGTSKRRIMLEKELSNFKKHFAKNRRQMTMLESGVLDEFIQYLSSRPTKRAADVRKAGRKKVSSKSNVEVSTARG